jgi:hypothetical protein
MRRANNQRQGMGRGLGRGYQNLVLNDPYIHSLSAKGIKLSTYTARNFNIDKKDILHSKEKHSGENVFNFMYNPRTGEMLLGGRTSHPELLRSRDFVVQEKSNFNEWVRGKYDKNKKILYVRHYFNPKSHYAEFTSGDFDISEKMQKKMVDVLKKKGLPKDVTVKYNQTNESLKGEGFVYV